MNSMNFFKHLKYLFLLCASLSCFFLSAQHVQQDIKNLKDSLLLKKGEDRVMILKDLGMKFKAIDYDSAWYYSKLAYKEAEQLKNEYLQARLLVSFGIFENGKGKSLEALEYYKKAVPAITASEDHSAIGALYTNMSNAYEKIGEVDKAVAYQLDALKAYEISKDSIWIAGSLNNLGSRYRAIEEWSLSKQYFEKALSLYQSLGYPYYVALCANNLASVYLYFEDYDQVVLYSEQAFKTLKKLGMQYESAIPLYNLGLGYKGLEKFKEAKAYLYQALEIQKDKGDWYVVIHLKKEIANILQLEGRLAEAEDLALEAYRDSYEHNLVIPRVKVLKVLSTVSNQLGKHKNAYEYLLEQSNFNDSLEGLERAKEALSLNKKFESEQKENEILRQKNELVENELAIKKRNNWLFISGALLVLIFILGFVLYRNQKVKAQNLAKDAALEKAMAEAKAQENLKEQRIRIARDLHDNIGSQLTYISSITDTAKRGIDKGEVFLMEKLTQMKQFSLVTISELRDTIWAMNKDQISVEDIVERTQQLAATVHEATANEVKVIINGITSSTVLNAFVGMNLFRIIQESINNAVKHAKSAEIQVTFLEQNKELLVLIEDDGKGFNMSEETQGNGLHIMKNRAQKAGIEFNQSSILGKGTKVELRLSL